MPGPAVTDYLKYVSLQLAAEAFLVYADQVLKTVTKGGSIN